MSQSQKRTRRLDEDIDSYSSKSKSFLTPSRSKSVNDISSTKKKSSTKSKNDMQFNEETMDGVYPETVSAYIEGLSDGIQYDIRELVESGVRAVKQFLPLSFLFGKNDQDATTVHPILSDNDCLQQFEVKESVTKNKNQIPIVNDEYTSAALRMRCPSMWKDKAPTNVIDLHTKSTKASNENSQNKNTQQKSESKKISLAKLYNSKDSNYYDCDEGGMVILGQKRMIYVVKNNDMAATANVQWWIAYTELHSCTLSFRTRYFIIPCSLYFIILCLLSCNMNINACM